MSLDENDTKFLLTSRLQNIPFANGTLPLSNSCQQLPPDCIGKPSH